MELELPYGPWTKVFSAQWKSFPLQILENPEHTLLVLLFEKADNEVTGILVLERKPFGIEGDLSKVLLAQKRDVTFVEKRSKNDSQQYLIVDATQEQLVSITSAGPNTNKRESHNEVLVADGETAVIGGLTQTQVSTNRSGIPILSKLPLIGRLFSEVDTIERKQDLLILITPHILDEGEVVKGAVKPAEKTP